LIAFVEKFLLGDTTTNTDVEISPYDPDLSDWITWDTPELEGASILPFIGEFNLMQNDPNPFSSITNINYYLEKESYVQISVYDIKGNKIRTLLNEQQSAGKQTVTFDGAELPSGIYIYKLKAGKLTKNKKMLLIH